jgi:hypothetical protein
MIVLLPIFRRRNHLLLRMVLLLLLFNIIALLDIIDHFLETPRYMTVTKLAAYKRVPGIMLLHLRNHVLLRNRLSLMLLLLTLLSIIILVFSTVAVLDIVSSICPPRVRLILSSAVTTGSHGPC